MTSRKVTSTRKPIEIRDGRVFTEAIEINAAWHCNIRCQSCSHASPSLPKQYVDLASVAANLTTLSKFMKVDHVRILGGEQLLHPQLNPLIEAIRVAGISDKVRLLTNGLILHQASPEFWRIVDEVHISVYPNTARVIERYLPALRLTAETYKVTLILKYFNYFRVSYRTDNGDQDLTERIYHTCQIGNVWRCITLEGGCLYRCPQATYLQLFSGETRDGRNLDFLEVDTITSALDIEQWLSHETSITSCQVCTGSVGKLHPHQQMRSTSEVVMTTATNTIDLDYLTLLESDMNANNSCIDREVVLNGN